MNPQPIFWVNTGAALAVPPQPVASAVTLLQKNAATLKLAVKVLPDGVPAAHCVVLLAGGQVEFSPVSTQNWTLLAFVVDALTVRLPEQSGGVGGEMTTVVAPHAEGGDKALTFRVRQALRSPESTTQASAV